MPSEDGQQVFYFTLGGRHLRTQDARTGVLLYQFGYTNAQLTTITDANNEITHIIRDGAGKPVRIEAQHGQVTTLGTDGSGKFLTSIANPKGEVYALAPDGGGLLQSMTNPRQHTWVYTFQDGRLLTDDDEAGGGNTFSVSESGVTREVTKTTREHRVTHYVVQQLLDGMRRRFTHYPDGVSTSLVDSMDTAAPYGEILVARTPTQPLRLDRPARDPRFGWLAPIDSVTVDTWGPGLVRSLTRSVASTGSTLQESFGVNAGPTSPRYLSSYDSVARVLTTRTPTGRTTHAELDLAGRPTLVSMPGLAPVTLSYDSFGKLLVLEQGDRDWHYSYDDRGRLATVSDPSLRVTSFTYDLADRESAQTLPGGRVVTMAYDANGNLISLAPPGRPAHGFGYSAVDLNDIYSPPAVPGIADPATRYQFNHDRQLTQVARPDGRTVTLGYGGMTGQLNTITQPRGASQFTYLPGKGQVETVSSPDNVMLTYEYAGPLLSKETWSGPVSGYVTHGYDIAFHDSVETVDGAWGVTYGYDADGLASSVTPASGPALGVFRKPEPGGTADNGLVDSTQVGGVVESLDYNTHGELQNLRYRFGSTVLLQQSLARDVLGRVTTITETTADGSTNTTGYTYDPAGRLETVSVGGVQQRRYEYDLGAPGNGNRTKEYGPGDALLSSAGYDFQDRLLTYGAMTYAYTAAGEESLRVGPGDTLSTTYDLLGNLILAKLAPATYAAQPDLPVTGTLISYQIDGQNRRVRKLVNGTAVQGWLYRDGLSPVAELDGTGAVLNRFVYCTQDYTPDLILRADGTYRVITDHLGSIRAIVNVTTGAVVQQIDYDAWGAQTQNTALSFQGLGYVGGIQDLDTRLVRFGARDYEPTTGRWTTRDPMGLTASAENSYAYVSLDPVNWVDASGEFKLPSDPGGLPPEWQRDPTHEGPNRQRFRNPQNPEKWLDFDQPQPGKPGWRGRPHWHHPDYPDEHLPPGFEIPDEPSCPMIPWWMRLPWELPIPMIILPPMIPDPGDTWPTLSKRPPRRA